MQTIGTRAKVWHGTAKKTSGGLTKTNLMMNKHGRIVSKRKHASGKKTIKYLKKLGYIAKKGKFKLFHKGYKSRKMRGGTGSALESTAAGTPALQNDLNFFPPFSPESPSTSSLKKGGRSRRMRGGIAYGGPLSPHSYDGQGTGSSGVGLQFVAGNAA